jgi:Condensation domain
MNSLEHITAFFSELRINAGAIWLENGAINFSAPKKFQNQETNNFIKDNKARLMAILNENGIFSIAKFLSVEIIRDSSNTHYPLSPAQERLWFIEQYEGGTNAYHVPRVYELDDAIVIEGIKYALQKIISRHEVLKSTIEQEDHVEYAIQRIHDQPQSSRYGRLPGTYQRRYQPSF